MNTIDFLKQAVLTREMIDRFLDETAHNWAKFDPELGYLLQAAVVRDGVDNSYTIGHYDSGTARRQQHYAHRPGRINAYGNSFTQCHQVSDGETWQEYLAAHFGEPIRNFGIGGYGVYQAYRRMLREEETRAAAEYVILNIWSDDHRRSIYSWRWLHIAGFRRRLDQIDTANEQAWMFHANPWMHLRLNPATGQFEDQPNLCPTPEALYQLCDLDYVVATFRDRFDVQARLAIEGVSDVQFEQLRDVADALSVPVDFSTAERAAHSAEAMLRHVALQSSMVVVDRMQAYTEQKGKKLLVLLSYSNNDVIRACNGENRFDQLFVDYLRDNNLNYVDTLQKHIEDYRQFNCSAQEYAARYYIGHYNPAGNHFFAFAIKNALVDWLDPKPPTYLDSGPSLQALATYLA